MKKGDKVRLISLEKHKDEGETNWILLEETQPQIGDVFIVSDIGLNSEWIGIGLEYYHPPCKFELVTDINTPPYYDNTKGSLYKIAQQRGWNHYLFDVVKRLERGGKKDPLEQEIDKTIALLQLWKSEL